MLRVADIALPFEHKDVDLPRKISKALNVHPNDIKHVDIVRRSIDARRKNEIQFIYTVDVEVVDEALALKRAKKKVTLSPSKEYESVEPTREKDAPRPIVVGTGPCGLFAGLILAEMGYRPILLERGKPVEDRVRDVYGFWKTGELDAVSNVQFGEGGAGTFSDGKLTTQIKEKKNRCRKVLEALVAAGAPREILYVNKPHIGTDVLVRVVKNLRTRVIELGGEVRFCACVSNLLVENGKAVGVELSGVEQIAGDAVVLAIGHSARDTFEMLLSRNVELVPKPFSIGVRIEHPQHMIDVAQFGNFAGHPRLGAADYKLVHHCKTGRSAYTFCMCPGGQVIGASSELGGVVTNGMSASKRDQPNANSGLLVGVKPDDFDGSDPLAGVKFQRQWEQRAFEVGGGNYHAPVQLVGDFLARKASTGLGSVQPTYTPGVKPTDLCECLPSYVTDTIREAIPAMNYRLKGFAMHDAVMTGVETRSSSPVRITRGDNCESVAVRGLYPAGEGAGYAGGIISAAVDGIKVAEAIVENHYDSN